MTVRPFARETRYAGRRFRSRLEARWAVFFDAAPIWVPWRYEYEGILLPGIGGYLPDFEAGPFTIEVKGEDARLDIGKCEAYATAAGRPLLILGDIPRPGDAGLHVYWCVNPSPVGWQQWNWAADGDRGTVSPRFYAPLFPRPEVNGVLCPVAGVRVPEHDEDPRVDAGYEAAHSQRFEWGETR
jgi:hypothetical protein